MKREKRNDSPLTKSAAEKETADFLQWANESGWKFEAAPCNAAPIFSNVKGEKKSIREILEDYRMDLVAGYQPMNKEFLRLAADEVSKKFPDGWGFILIAAPLGVSARTTYTANVDRADAIKLLKELLFNWGESENWMKHIS